MNGKSFAIVFKKYLENLGKYNKHAKDRFKVSMLLKFAGTKTYFRGML
jgi:hypothetical protein